MSTNVPAVSTAAREPGEGTTPGSSADEFADRLAAVGHPVGAAELVGDLVHTEPGPTFADDHLVALALNGEPGALAVLSARRLAPFATLRTAQRESLLATLDAWLRHWGSRTAVSAELFVHPQTVSYRLSRLRELLGDDLDDPAVRFELHLVLAFRETAR